MAGIPLHSPQEGIEELEFAVKTLGLKVINIAGGVRARSSAIAEKYPAAEHPEIAKQVGYIDFYGIDSEYNYDPFWAKVVELGASAHTHYGSQGWTGRQSISNYMNNHIGHFADGSQAFAKALFFGGVTAALPGAARGLLEGGADWGSHVYTHLVDRWEKRNRRRCSNYDPRRGRHRAAGLAVPALRRRLVKGRDARQGHAAARQPGHLGAAAQPRAERDAIDDFAAAGIEKVEDIRDRWVNNFYFGPEADDRTVASRLQRPRRTRWGRRSTPSGPPTWATGTCPDPHRGARGELGPRASRASLGAADFKACVFGNPYRLYTEANPRLLRGHRGRARKLAAPGARPPAFPKNARRSRCVMKTLLHNAGHRVALPALALSLGLGAAGTPP